MNDKIAFLILLILILGCVCLERKFKKIENWEMYKQKAYGFINTGSGPLSFYERPRYRKPYRYPVTPQQSYPTQHNSFGN